jgi:hypothetical protein
MLPEIVSYIIALFHVYRDCVKYLWLGVIFSEIVSNIDSLVSCIQRLCQILLLGVMFTEMVSHIIAWCHV